MSVRVCLFWQVVLVAGVVPGLLHAQGSPKATAPIPVASAASSTNTPSRKDPLKALEEQLTKSFQSLAPNNSLDGVMAPPTAPLPRPTVPNNKRVLEWIEKRKNALQITTEDLALKPGEEELFEPPSFDQKGKASAKKNDLDKFYEDLDRRRTLRKTLGLTDAEIKSLDSQKATGLMVAPDESDESSLPGSIGDAAQKLRRLLGTEPEPASADRTASAPTRRPDYSELFGLGTSPKVDNDFSAPFSIQQYNEWLSQATASPGSPAGLGNPVNAMAVPDQKPGLPYNPMESALPGSSRSSSGLGQLGAINPVLSPGPPQDLTAKVVNQWNPFYSPAAAAPKVEAPSYIPPKPNFDAPRRKF